MGKESYLGSMWRCLRYISVGKYNQGLFLGGSSSFSTLCGGVSTLLLGAIILAYSVVLFRDVITRSHYNFETTINDLKHWEDINKFTLGDLDNHFIKAFIFFLDKDLYPSCDHLEFEATVRYSSTGVIKIPLVEFNSRYTNTTGCSFVPVDSP